MVSDENTVDEIGDSFAGLHFLPDAPTLEELARTIRSLDASGVAAVVVSKAGVAGPDRLAGATIPPPVDGRIAARCTPMTDAIKRVEGNRVVETVDRDGLLVVEWPMVVPIGLAIAWACDVLDPPTEAVDASSAADRRRRPTAAALLSHFVRIEPGLRVVGIDDLSY